MGVLWRKNYPPVRGSYLPPHRRPERALDFSKASRKTLNPCSSLKGALEVFATQKGPY